jgi:membrane protease YdiL (CAAX protease family)
MGFVGLVLALVLALVGGLLVDIPAALLGAKIQSSKLSPGLELADTAVQDLGFVAAAVILAGSGGRVVRAWQFGLRRPRVSWLRLALAVPATYAAFFLFNGVWAELLNLHEKEKLLETLGANEGAWLLILSASLTCVLAPVCEEFLFRGFFFRALSNWRGPWPAAVMTGIVFGGVHAGSAPVGDLIPLGFLGFCLCWLYRQTGSLYPGIVVHAANNCIAFAYLEHWSWQHGALLLLGTLAALTGAVALLKSLGLIGEEPAPAELAAQGSLDVGPVVHDGA